MLIVIKFLTWAASPIGLLVWGTALGLGLYAASRWRKTGIGLIALSLFQLVFFALPMVSDRLLGHLENQARSLAQENNQASRLLQGETYAAIVLLGGATKPASPPLRPDPDLGDAVDRIWYAARLYKKGLAPKIIVSGGRSAGLESRQDIQTEAQAMQMLLLDLGVPEAAIVLESSARSTRENASKVRALVPQGTIALVTSAFHMPRSIRNFQRERLSADAYPTDFRVAPQVEAFWQRLLPRADALNDSETALKEYIALVFNY
jgi:uncharacterized SAM-binding protein YcdF (DUF218 family)